MLILNMSYKAQITRAEHWSLGVKRRKTWGGDQQKSVSVFTTVVQTPDTGLRISTLTCKEAINLLLKATYSKILKTN